jgi:ribosomal protein S18 acetylase RimI-like enzyme
VKVRIRRFQEADEERTLRFLNSVFTNWGDNHKFRWKFKEVEEALGREAAVWVVESGSGEIVGHLAFIPLNIRIAGHVFPACQLVDGALSPRHRGRGVYTSLVHEVLSDAEEKGNVAAFGFANRPAYHNYARHGGFLKLGNITRMFKVLSLGNVMSTVRLHTTPGGASIARNDSLTRDFYSITGRETISTMLNLSRVMLGSIISCCLRPTSKVKSVPELKRVEANVLGKKLGPSWIKLASDYQFAFERNNKYLEWRYGQPGARYRAYALEKSGHVAGYVVVGVEQKSVDVGKITLHGLKVGHIMDLVAEKNMTAPLLSRAEEELKKQGICLVNCWTIANTLLFDVFRSTGYYQIPTELAKVTLVAKIHDPRLENAISSENRKGMLIMLGDTDHV